MQPGNVGLRDYRTQVCVMDVCMTVAGKRSVKGHQRGPQREGVFDGKRIVGIVVFTLKDCDTGNNFFKSRKERKIKKEKDNNQ